MRPGLLVRAQLQEMHRACRGTGYHARAGRCDGEDSDAAAGCERGESRAASHHGRRFSMPPASASFPGYGTAGHLADWTSRRASQPGRGARGTSCSTT